MTLWPLGQAVKTPPFHGGNRGSRYKKCEVLELKLNPYEDINKCMDHRTYKRIRGKIQQL
ncbi:hypothetical protein C3B64_18060 [Clostridium botulinum]|uniref:Uncharacterized protein n=1 Tax=Clostridium botulinum TaxID=1491 RepID=A0AAU8YZW7_CLOBO|nr:hypothetical protein C3B64_18060 [Clostridium botulinum]